MGGTDALLVAGLFVAAFGAVLAGVPVAFALGGAALLTAAAATAAGLFDPAFLGAIPSRIYGTAMYNEVLTAVPLFILMGVLLEKSRVAEDLLDSMARACARIPAGLGVSVTLVGALLAASTGIVGATVVAMGLISLPTMLRRGYDPALASGSICAAGTLGQIIPPSIVLVILGDQLSSAYVEAQRAAGNFAPDPVSVGDLFAGALIPGLGLAVLYMLYQLAVGIFRPQAAPRLPKSAHEPLDWRELAVSLVAPVALILVVLGSILAGVATPTEAAGVGALGAALLAGRKVASEGGGLSLLLVNAGIVAGLSLPLIRAAGDLRATLETITVWNGMLIALAMLATTLLLVGTIAALAVLARRGLLGEAVYSTMRIATLAFTILVGATIFTLVFRALGGDAIVAAALDWIPGGPLGAVIAINLLVFVLGFFLDFIEIVFIVMPIVAPVVLQAGVDPVWFGVLIALNLQTSFMTPPFGFALFYLRAVAPEEIETRHVYRGIVPFVAIQVLALVLLFAFPGLATWLPAQLGR